MIGHDGVMEEEVETKAEQGEQEEQGEEKPGEKIIQTRINFVGLITMAGAGASAWCVPPP